MSATWTIDSLKVASSEQRQNIVFEIFWRASKTQDALSATNYGSVTVSYVEGDPFTPFEELTLDQVIGWAKAALGEEKVAEIEAGIEAEFQQLLNPTVLSPALPWS